MAIISDNSRRSLIPSFLYSSSSLPSNNNSPDFDHSNKFSMSPLSSSSSPLSSPSKNGASSPTKFVVAAPSEKNKIRMYSPAFYGASTVAGTLSCGLTHMAVTPLDLVKCNMQGVTKIDAALIGGFSTMMI